MQNNSGELEQPTYWADSEMRRTESGTGYEHWQPLRTHLVQVGTLAREFGFECSGREDFARRAEAAGLLHDLWVSLLAAKAHGVQPGRHAGTCRARSDSEVASPAPRRLHTFPIVSETALADAVGASCGQPTNLLPVAPGPVRLVQYNFSGKHYSVGFSTREAVETALRVLANAGRTASIIEPKQTITRDQLPTGFG